MIARDGWSASKRRPTLRDERRTGTRDRIVAVPSLSPEVTPA